MSRPQRVESLVENMTGTIGIDRRIVGLVGSGLRLIGDRLGLWLIGARLGLGCDRDRLSFCLDRLRFLGDRLRLGRDGDRLGLDGRGCRIARRLDCDRRGANCL
jgi:hypothetical protein